MKITEGKRTIIRSIILFLILPWGFLFSGIFVGMFFLSALPGGANLSKILIYIANWPSLLFKIYPFIITPRGKVVWDVGRGLIHPLVILFNAIGWGLIGFIVGLIISVIKGRKRHQVG